MHHILLDTNTWIYLANGTEPVKLLAYIKDEVDVGNIRILLPEIIIKEWNQNKESTVKVGTLKHFNDITESLERILKLLGDKGERSVFGFLLDYPGEVGHFKDIYDVLRNKRKEIEDAIHENIKLIEYLFSHANTVIIPASTNVMLKSGECAINKEPPFLKKNSFADAVIFFSFIEYVTTNSINEAFFITYNTDDFCEKKDGKKILHNNLDQALKDVNARFYSIVGEALNTIKKDIVSKEELELIRLHQEEYEEYDDSKDSIEYCDVCDSEGNEVYINQQVYIHDLRTRTENPNQMEFDFAKSMRKTISKELPEFMSVGNCNWCDTIHFECPECKSITGVTEDEYDMPKYCEGCGLLVYIDTSGDRENIGEGYEYYIVDEVKTCEKCQQEREFFVGDVCVECEEEYV